MIPVDIFAGRDVAVFGLGLSGIGTARALAAGGAHVFAWDDTAQKREKAQAAGVQIGDLSIADWSRFAALILSPGVPLTHPIPHWAVTQAKAAGVEVIGDTELFFRQHRAKGGRTRVVVITGTNGKSTTTALTAHLLKSAGRKVALGGNIGRAVLDLDPFEDDFTYVLELSSFQIDLTPAMHPNAAALLNITPDHLDRHGTLENYAAIKARIFDSMSDGDTAVIGIDDGPSRAIAESLEGRPFALRRISVEAPVETGVYADQGMLVEMEERRETARIGLEGIGSLRGAHNWQNAAAAFALARAEGLGVDEIEKGLRSFPGLAHRMQQVARLGPILYVNDSKATNADAAAKALASYENIYWIAGGRPKEGGLAGLDRYFPKIASAYLLGEAAAGFAEQLGDSVPYKVSQTLENAIAQATKDAQSAGAAEAVILLSPACASYDQFENFEKRGEAFVAAVMAIPGVQPIGAKGEGLA